MENKTNIGEEQNVAHRTSHFLFVSNIQKKTFHTKTHFGTKMTASTIYCWCRTFWGLKWFLCEMFFFVYSKRKGKWESSSSVLFLTYICFVFYQKKLYSWGRRSGAFFMKNSQQLDDVPIVILSIYFSWGMIEKK